MDHDTPVVAKIVGRYLRAIGIVEYDNLNILMIGLKYRSHRSPGEVGAIASRGYYRE